MRRTIAMKEIQFKFKIRKNLEMDRQNDNNTNNSENFLYSLRFVIRLMVVTVSMLVLLFILF